MNSTALATIDGNELEVIQRTAKLLAASGYFGADGGVVGMAQVAAKIMAGRELGFGPFASVNGIHIIQGKPTVGANLMAAAVRAHPRYDYRVKELSDTICELEFLDNGKPAGNSRFTIEEAKIAELSTGKNQATWKKYPRNMLFARAMSNGVRWYAPDIFSGNAVYLPEELDAEVDADGNVIDLTPRAVEPTTGEIINTLTMPIANPVDGDELFETTQRPLATPLQLKQFDELGKTYYHDEWPEPAAKLVEGASKGEVSDPAKLLESEIKVILLGLQKRISVRDSGMAVAK